MPVEIVWLGHACFRIRSGGLTLITDPFPEAIGLSMGQPDPPGADLVTVSHQHPHHSHTQGLANEPRVISGPGEYELSGIYIRGVRTSPGEDDPSEKRNTAYLVHAEEIRICHLGDISQPLSESQAGQLTPVHVLLVPAGGVCTLSAASISETITTLSPRIVIPMHHHVPGLQLKLEPLEPFLRERGLGHLEPQPRLTVSPSTLPEETRVVVLEPQGR
ncbi:MAG: MBL fold metallo-hydrolase, partial [Dehalococcoidia bacterium]